MGYVERSDFKRAWIGHLVEDVDVVACQVEEDQAAEASERSLLHPTDVAALQRQVGEVRGLSESSGGEFLDVVPSKVQFHCNLRTEENKH